MPGIYYPLRPADATLSISVIAVALLVSSASADPARSAAPLEPPPPQGSNGGVPSIYSVAGVRVGARVQFDSSEYREYSCHPSERFHRFTLCRKIREGKERRGAFRAVHSLLHAADGTVVYVSRYQDPAFFRFDKVVRDIYRYSRHFGEAPRIERVHGPGSSRAVIASWGKVAMEQLDEISLRTLASGQSPRKGYLIDFMGDAARSAREGLPVYRLSGGAGFVWAGNFDQKGRGTLRFAALEASAFYPELTGAAETEVPLRPNETAHDQTELDADITRDVTERAEKEGAGIGSMKPEIAATTQISQLKQPKIERSLAGLGSEKDPFAIALISCSLISAAIGLAAGFSIAFVKRRPAADHGAGPEPSRLIFDTLPTTTTKSPAGQQPQADATQPSCHPSIRPTSEHAPQPDRRPIRIYRIDPRLLAQG